MFFQPKKAKTVSEKPRKKRNKGEKDENKPKRAMSAYFLWLNASREDIKSKNPGISVTDLSKKAGELWRELQDKTVRGEYSRNKSYLYSSTPLEGGYVGAGGPSVGSRYIVPLQCYCGCFLAFLYWVLFCRVLTPFCVLTPFWVLNTPERC